MAHSSGLARPLRRNVGAGRAAGRWPAASSRPLHWHGAAAQPRPPTSRRSFDSRHDQTECVSVLRSEWLAADTKLENSRAHPVHPFVHTVFVGQLLLRPQPLRDRTAIGRLSEILCRVWRIHVGDRGMNGRMSVMRQAANSLRTGPEPELECLRFDILCPERHLTTENHLGHIRGEGHRCSHRWRL